MDVDDELDELFAIAMRSDTLATIGRPNVELRHVFDMAPMTDTDPENWDVYIGSIADEHGNMWAYIGNSVAEDGSTKRLIKCYKKG